ncbi:MAG: hypothetical protein LBF56_03380 [Holosporales bacterium]|jgi:hypothetical protein|nr:hypothetical protein [Holosporales bacterium]
MKNILILAVVLYAATVAHGSGHKTDENVLAKLAEQNDATPYVSRAEFDETVDTECKKLQNARLLEGKIADFYGGVYKFRDESSVSYDAKEAFFNLINFKYPWTMALIEGGSPGCTAMKKWSASVWNFVVLQAYWVAAVFGGVVTGINGLNQTVDRLKQVTGGEFDKQITTAQADALCYRKLWGMDTLIKIARETVEKRREQKLPLAGDVDLVRDDHHIAYKDKKSKAYVYMHEVHNGEIKEGESSTATWELNGYGCIWTLPTQNSAQYEIKAGLWQNGLLRVTAAEMAAEVRETNDWRKQKVIWERCSALGDNENLYGKSLYGRMITKKQIYDDSADTAEKRNRGTILYNPVLGTHCYNSYTFEISNTPFAQKFSCSLPMTSYMQAAIKKLFSDKSLDPGGELYIIIRDNKPERQDKKLELRPQWPLLAGMIIKWPKEKTTKQNDIQATVNCNTKVYDDLGRSPSMPLKNQREANLQVHHSGNQQILSPNSLELGFSDTIKSRAVLANVKYLEVSGGAGNNATKYKDRSMTTLTLLLKDDDLRKFDEDSDAGLPIATVLLNQNCIARSPELKNLLGLDNWLS